MEFQGYQVTWTIKLENIACANLWRRLRLRAPNPVGGCQRAAAGFAGDLGRRYPTPRFGEAIPFRLPSKLRIIGRKQEKPRRASARVTITMLPHHRALAIITSAPQSAVRILS
ncbi:uncharacterized protein LOC122616733 [Drosophila teissieri]|uniref:uncharacterized protein LOC122616733 n=1 Tax=Drosophila teissieri TaxID=7243 RepID=UPI001CBA3E39|nr:uncharacterized protein LOC122616733 [Drosophila teissieri]